jgi:pyruvate,water dikinase
LPVYIKTNRSDSGLISPPVIQIPASLVVTADAFREFMRNNRLDEVVEGLLQGVNVKQIEAILNPSSQIQQIIRTSPLPGGIYDGILNGCREMGYGAMVVWPMNVPPEIFYISKKHQQFPLREATGPEATIEVIREFWASLFDPAAIFYRELNGQLHRDARITLVVQGIPTPR